jgi:hypothetical protein
VTIPRIAITPSLPFLTTRPRGTHWSVAVVYSAVGAVKLGVFPTRADAEKAARVASQILGVAFMPLCSFTLTPTP